MKTIIIFFSIIVFAFIGCKDEDNPIVVDNSIEGQINSSKPINDVSITYRGATQSSPPYSLMYFHRSFTPPTLDDAFAENGYLVVKSLSKTHFFPLQTAKIITIENHYIKIEY